MQLYYSTGSSVPRFPFSTVPLIHGFPHSTVPLFPGLKIAVRLVFLQFVFENLYSCTVFKGDFNGIKIKKLQWKDAMLWSTKRHMKIHMTYGIILRDYKPFALYCKLTNIGAMYRAWSAESNGGIFVLVGCTKPEIRTSKVSDSTVGYLYIMSDITRIYIWWRVWLEII